MGTYGESIRNIEDNTQSAATGAWVGAGFQAAAAFQSARAAQAAEEQLELERTRDERDKQHRFAMWSQTTPDGVAFLAWRKQAEELVKFLRKRDAEWLSVWAWVIRRAQMETPQDEKRRFAEYPARLWQAGLRLAVILSFVIAALFTARFAFQTFTINLRQDLESADAFTYEQCLEQLNDPENLMFNEADCEAIKPETATTSLYLLIFFVGLGLFLAILRHIKRRAARADLTVAREAQSRIARWGFDPLTVEPGYTAFPWSRSQNSNDYANWLVQFARNARTSYPSQSQLIRLAVPNSYPPARGYPAEVNEVLEKFQHERP